MAETQPTYALITGASKGIGKAMAIALAKRKVNLLLVARDATALNDLQNEIQHTYDVTVHYLAIDLTITNAASELYEWVAKEQLNISILINNAGYGLWGKFSELKLTEQLEMCQLNINVLTSLCHYFIPMLQKEKQAYILNVCSTAAYQAVPTMAVYSATKAYVLSFTRALRFELKDSPVSVTCFSPGPVDTGFAARAGLDAFSKMAEKFNMKPDEVAEIALKGMFAKKSEIIPGFTNIISVYANRVLPKAFIEKIAAGIYKV
ncbi:short-chain dehydrogenase [Pedobacter kyungheensis]|uniref:Short-chain dehydrogenase n=1 Tax=Pedobacter kyungheensis TaxID=1069985 RepID=A0A0C1FV72_9SPHI|nr:SDR family oxidoreductase [Pedobacter kyungheensis]KIA96882.1 short-chain dehydrogenase [Pedobacter kyungheensis]